MATVLALLCCDIRVYFEDQLKEVTALKPPRLLGVYVAEVRESKQVLAPKLLYVAL
jgi:hypothetical protein